MSEEEDHTGRIVLAALFSDSSNQEWCLITDRHSAVSLTGRWAGYINWGYDSTRMPVTPQPEIPDEMVRRAMLYTLGASLEPFREEDIEEEKKRDTVLRK